MKVRTQLTNNENRKWTNMKLQSVSCIVFVLLFIVASSAYAKPSAGVLFQSGLYKEEVNGDLEAAIQIYERVLKEFLKDRPVAAKALLHIGLCYEKLGKQQAQKAYQRVIQEFADQQEVVTKARARLSKLEQPAGITEPKGITVRQVWAGTGVDVLGVPSPDGRYLSYVDWETGDLAIYEIATGKKRRLTNKGTWDESDEYAYSSRWSTDSTQIAYQWCDREGHYVELCVRGLEDSEHHILYSIKNRNEWIEPHDWSPDGKHILACLSEKDGNKIVLVSAADGSVRVLKTLDKFYPKNMCFSPDGRFIAYDRPQAEGASERDIFVFDLSDDRESAVVKHPDNDKLLGWTPDGKYIFFASDRIGSWDAWLLQVAGGEPQGFPERVKQDIGDVTPIGFTQTGSYYYRNEQLLRDVFMATLDLETGKVLSEPVPVRQTGATTCHDWSPDSQYLAYCTQRPDKTQRIYIRTLATGQERMLADNLPYIRWLRWSLDGQSILIDRFKRGDSQGVIFKIGVQTGERTDLVRSETEVLVRPEVSPDGKTLFYGRGDPVSRTSRLVARDLQSGREKELFRNVPPARLTGSALSPDGQRFVLSIIPSPTRPAAPVLKILSAAGGEPRELIQFDKSEKLLPVGVAWMPDSQDVLFWKWFLGGKDLELWRISAEGGEPRKLWARKTLGHLRVHPDGQRIAFNSRSTTSEMWVMENFLPESKAGE